MTCESDYFVRELDINFSNSVTCVLQLYQKSVGDVNCIVWDASMVLAKYLEVQHLKNPSYFKNLNVLELGAGVGCVGLTAAIFGAHVTLTDLPDALPIMKDNITYNERTMQQSQGTATATVLKWGEKVDIPQRKYHLIVLSDCVYYSKSIKPLVHTLMDLCDKKTEILQCQEIRDSLKQKCIWNTYLKILEQEFLVDQISTAEQHPDFSCSEIMILKISKK